MIVYNKTENFISITVTYPEGSECIDTRHLIEPGYGIDLSVVGLEVEKKPNDFEAYHHETNEIIVKLHKKLEIAIAALEKIAKDFGTDYCDGNCVLARETLDKLER